MKSLKSQAEENMKSKEEIDKLYADYLEVRKEYEEVKQEEQEIMMKLSKENISKSSPYRVRDLESEVWGTNIWLYSQCT